MTGRDSTPTGSWLQRFLRPRWRRAVLLGLIAAWAGVELWRGNAIWAVVAAAALLYGGWDLFLSGHYDAAANDSDETPPADE